MRERKNWLIIFLIVLSIGILSAKNISEEFINRTKEFVVKRGFCKEYHEIELKELNTYGNESIERYEVKRKETSFVETKKTYLGTIVIVADSCLYQIPYDYNRYIQDKGETITKENAFIKVQELIKLWITTDVMIEKIEWKNLSSGGENTKNFSQLDELMGGYAYSIKAISNSPAYGIKMEWNIGFYKNRFSEIKATPIAFPEGIFKECDFMGSIYSSFSDGDVNPDYGIEVTDCVSNTDLSFRSLNYGGEDLANSIFPHF